MRHPGRFSVVAALLAGGGILLLGQGLSRAYHAPLNAQRLGVDIVTMATPKAKPASPKPAAAQADLYFCLVTAIDGSASVQELSRDSAEKLEKDLLDRRKEAVAKWLELKKRWTDAAGARSFPVPLPKPPAVARLARVPAADKSHQTLTDKYNGELQQWDVCLVKDQTGTASAEAIQHDKVYARQIELATAYVNAVLDRAAGDKDNPAAVSPKTDAPRNALALPTVQAVKSAIINKELADKYATSLARKLAEQNSKKPPEPAGP